MKASTWNTSALVTLVLTGSLPAEVIYSNLQNSVIATNLTGLFVDVNGDSNWDINPFFGGVGVANTDLFQPVRTGTGNLDAISNFSVGDTIDVSKLFSTGYGGSQTHLGSTFTAGQEGYLGFKQDGNYGWMRVVFTVNTSGAVVKDWAYESSGAAISVGRIQQSAAVANAQTVTLSPAIGESFTLGSQITDTDGNVNSVLKTGGGITVLGGSNTYTGATNVDAGTLLINGSQTSATGVVTVASAATDATAVRLGGTGTIGGSTVFNPDMDGAPSVGNPTSNPQVGGIHSPGNSVGRQVASDGSIGKQTFAGDVTYSNGSIFEWELSNTPAATSITDNTAYASNRGTAYDAVNITGGQSKLMGTDAIFRVVLQGNQDFSDAFWTQQRTWTDIFRTGDGTGSSNLDLASTFGGGFQYYNYSGTDGAIKDIGAPTTYGSFSVSGSTLTWTAVPEPTSALVGLLIAVGLLRRHRA